MIRIIADEPTTPILIIKMLSNFLLLVCFPQNSSSTNVVGTNYKDMINDNLYNPFLSQV